MTRRLRRIGLTPLAWLLVFAVLGSVLVCGVRTAGAQEAPERYTPASRSPRVERLERAEVVALAADAFGRDLAERVAAIVWCESSGRPGADTNWPYVGLAQVDPYLHAERVAAVVGYPVTPGEAAWLLRDPAINLATASLIYREQGWRAWPYCRWAS